MNVTFVSFDDTLLKYGIPLPTANDDNATANPSNLAEPHRLNGSPLAVSNANESEIDERVSHVLDLMFPAR